MTKLNENTGLPELPDGYFWRVTTSKRYDSWGDRYFQVSLIKGATRKLNWWLKYVAPVFVDVKGSEQCVDTSAKWWLSRLAKQADEAGVTVEEAYRRAISKTAEQMYKQNELATLQRQFDAVLEDYAGSYPPKKLGE